MGVKIPAKCGWSPAVTVRTDKFGLARSKLQTIIHKENTRLLC